MVEFLLLHVDQVAVSCGEGNVFVEHGFNLFVCVCITLHADTLYLFEEFIITRLQSKNGNNVVNLLIEIGLKFVKAFLILSVEWKKNIAFVTWFETPG